MMNAKLRVNSPCQNCKSRYLGCHDECVGYQNYKRKKDEINSVLREGKTEIIDEYRIVKTQKVKKSKGVKSW